MKDIIGTGLSGLVGSRITDLLQSSFTFTNLSLETGVDITNYKKVKECITNSRASWLFHLAAYTDVTASEKEKGLKEKSVSWQVNAMATEYLVDLCQQTGKRMLYISTDYVFDGTKSSYLEDDEPNPFNWYGLTKREGEKRMSALGDKALIIRIANPYRSHPVGKKDFVHKILERLSANIQVQAPSNQIFTPTYIDDLACAIEKLVAVEASGYYHVVAKKPLSPYQAGIVIAKVYGFDEHLVSSISYEEYFEGKPKPPKHAALKHDKINKLGQLLHTFEEGVALLHKQENI